MRAVGQLALVSTIVVAQLTRGDRWTTSCYHLTLAGIWILATIPSDFSLNTPPPPVHQPLDNKRNNAVNSQLGPITLKSMHWLFSATFHNSPGLSTDY